MTRDERIIAYLRARGRDRPPDGFVSSVMAALDDPMPSRSRFAAWVPAVAIAAGAAVVAAVTILIGQGQDVGPGPSPATSAPTPSASAEPTIDDLGVALLDAVDVLRAAPGVEGRQQVEIAGTIGSVTWFDWRPNGDQVIVQRQDLDVTETGWWMVPDGAPPATGRRIYTNIRVKVGDDFFFTNEAGDWEVAPRDDSFPTGGFGPAILDGSILPWRPLDGLVSSLGDPSQARVERDDLPGGGVEWKLAFEWMGAPLSQRWTIGPGGELRSWTFERQDRSVDPDGDFNANATLGWLQYTITDGDPIEPPDTDTEPDAADVGLPADFPLGPGAGEVDYRSYVEDALDALEAYHWNSATIDWAAARSAALDGLPDEPTPGQAHQRIIAAIQTFDTFNTVFVRPGDVPPPDATAGPTDLPQGDRIGEIAMVMLPAPSGSDPEALREYLGAARDQMAAADAPDPACGWIVDARAAAGGASGPLFAAVGGLLGEGRAITFDSAVSDWWVDVDASGTVSFGSEAVTSEVLGSPMFAAASADAERQHAGWEAAMARERPYRPATGDLPVVVLTSSATFSAGEQLVVAFQGRSDTRTIGGVTGGSPQSLLSLHLVDGAVLRMPTATPIDRDGTRYSANIIPDESAPPGDAGVDAAVEWLQRQPGCS
jgi:hypothetical protein